MDEALQQEVWRRAGRACEYCRMPQRFYCLPFQIDHIIAQQHGGPTESDNLALSCLHCNAHKGPNLASVDPPTQQIAPLFHPRGDRWEDHFVWRDHELVGRKPVGRATIRCLGINDPANRAVRAALMFEGVFPP